MTKIRWGVLSTAKIGWEKVIPAMQAGKYSEIIAIASAKKEKAEVIANKNNIEKVFDSYEALLADPDIQAVYIPLPNHLHVPWSIKALHAGKHVLCEKPIALSAAEAAELLQVSLQYPHLKIMEAFMYRFHPQWHGVKQMIADGSIGKLRTIQSVFSYYNIDPLNVRNQKDIGGGGLMDIGCYPISTSRFIFGQEPEKVSGTLEFDPVFKTDMMTSAILEFKTGTATFTCSTQAVPYQHMNIIGSEARIELEIPFTPAFDNPAIIWLHSKTHSQQISFDATNQYTLQGDQFSLAILNNEETPTALTDAVNNMKVIDAIFESVRTGHWETV